MLLARSTFPFGAGAAKLKAAALRELLRLCCVCRSCRLELALNHQQAIDLSEDEGDRNDDWVPDYAFPVAAADKKILPPRNWRDPSEDGDDSDFLML